MNSKIEKRSRLFWIMALALVVAADGINAQAQTTETTTTTSETMAAADTTSRGVVQQAFIAPQFYLSQLASDDGAGMGIEVAGFVLPIVGAGVTFNYINYSTNFKRYGLSAEAIGRLPLGMVEPSISWLFGYNWLDYSGGISSAQDVAGWITGPAANLDIRLGASPVSLGVRVNYLVPLQNSGDNELAGVIVAKAWL